MVGMVVIHWLTENWFNLLQSLGIISSCLFTVVVIRIDKRSRRVSNLILITKENGDIWAEVYKRPELSRVLDESADLANAPMTQAEQLFVQQLILHLAATWRAMDEGEFMPLEGLEEDIKSFFALPIPGTLWKTAKRFQDKAFVAFVENAFL